MEGDSPNIVAVKDACCFARRVCGEPLTWALFFPRGHRLDFLIGLVLGLKERAPDKELIQDSIFILWLIWCARNDVLFKSIKVDVDCAFAMFFRRSEFMQVHS